MENVSLLVYTDGSYTNDGVTGSALFGYTYKEENKGKKHGGLPRNVNITTDGILSKEEVNDKTVHVIPDAYVSKTDTAISFDNIVVNSAYAEAYTMMLLLMVINNLKREGKEVTELYIKTDSQMLVYVLDGLTSGQSPEKYAYYTIYKPLNDFLTEFKSKGYKLKYKHVKAHVNIIGNEIVDKLASFAREERKLNIIKNENNQNDKIDAVKTTKFNYFPQDKKKDSFWTVNNIPNYFMGKEIHFLTEPEREDRILYSFKYPKKKEPGEKDGAALIGMTIEKNKDDMINEIIKSELEYLIDAKDYDARYGGVGKLNFLDLNNINDPFVNLFKKLGFPVLGRYANGDIFVQSITKYPISKVVRPGILGVSLIESMEFNKDILESYFRDEVKEYKTLEDYKAYPGGVMVKLLDVTDYFFTKEKGKMKLTMPIVKDFTSFEIKIELDGKEKKISCVPGTDIPIRNNIKKLELMEDVKVILVLWNNGNMAFNYGYIFDTVENGSRACSFWYNKYSSLFFK